MFAKARISQEIPGAANAHCIANHLHFMGADTGQDPGKVMMAATEGGDKAPAIKREGIIRFPFRENASRKADWRRKPITPSIGKPPKASPSPIGSNATTVCSESPGAM